MDYGDSDFLADNDRSIRDFRENEKASKQHIVKQMVKLRHNLQYNKHLLSVYLKAKTIFDEMVEEHRAQIHHLDEIYRHLSKLIHTELTRHKSSKKRRDDGGGIVDNKPMIKELVKDKQKIGKLLSNMRKGLDKLMEIDTIIGTTVEKINEIQFIEDNDGADDDDEDDAEDEASDESDDDDEDSDESDDDDDEEAEASEEDAEDSASDAEEEDEDDAEEDDDDDEVDEDSASEAEEEEDDDESESEASEEEDDDEGAEDSEADASEEDDAEEDEEPVVFY